MASITGEIIYLYANITLDISSETCRYPNGMMKQVKLGNSTFKSCVIGYSIDIYLFLEYLNDIFNDNDLILLHSACQLQEFH